MDRVATIADADGHPFDPQLAQSFQMALEQRATLETQQRLWRLLATAAQSLAGAGGQDQRFHGRLKPG